MDVDLFDDEMLFDSFEEIHEDPMIIDTEQHVENPAALSSPPSPRQSASPTLQASLNERSPAPSTPAVFPTPASPKGNGVELPPGKRDRNWVLARVESVFEDQIDGITDRTRDLAILVKSRPQKQTQTHAIVRQLRFPGRSEKEAWRYTVVIRILELVHEALAEGKTITKRDIYYRDPALFSKQAIVDRYVDDLAYTFGVPRASLSVTAAAKGLVAGNFAIRKHDGAVVDGKAEREGLLISQLNEDDAIDLESVHWVLVIEKEATFHSLCSSDFWSSITAFGIVITAKGYPDIATRSLLRSIALPSKQNGFRHRIVCALMDFDPDGIDILSTYKHGSTALAHEKSKLALPSIRWLGLNSEHIGHRTDLHQAQGLLSLSARDRRKANRMLEREPFVEHGEEPTWRREVQAMLFLNVKAEVQLLEAQEGGLSQWLRDQGLS